ncbi:hypothetical protein F993_01658 [Acinetobacter proteolyticus]|uniref:Uncharacterized protein n=1 Tax=Acinetobacter proteolyticus TaxID=1776741 RepID=A0ABP2TMC4_9GAMM|nr:hypothetical protein [Acinetobacter proteolyticus]ENU23505.1 hypothetical protein F993_01658 [Acinetobacter proteolyticus]
MEGLKQVRANQKGFYKDRLVQDGEIFAVGEDETGLWFDDIEPAEKPKTSGRSTSSNKTAE